MSDEEGNVKIQKGVSDLIINSMFSSLFLYHLQYKCTCSSMHNSIECTSAQPPNSEIAPIGEKQKGTVLWGSPQ